MFNYQFLILFLLLPFTYSFAGSTGYIFEGKTYYIYKDGKLVNESPMKQVNRVPASVNSHDPDSMILYFSEDAMVRCYFWSKKLQKQSKRQKKDSNIHCFKLSELTNSP